MRLWVDDLRTPPDDTWTWAKTADEAIAYIDSCTIVEMSLDHDLGGEPMGATETTRPIVLWLCEQPDDKWPHYIRVHSWNPIGAMWLKEMCERYHPYQTFVPYQPSEKHWSGEEVV